MFLNENLCLFYFQADTKASFLLLPATSRFPSFWYASKAARKHWDRLRDPWWLGKAGDQPVLEVNPTCSCRASMETGHALPQPHKPGLTVLQSAVERSWSSSNTNTCMATKGVVAAFLGNQEQERKKKWRSDKNCPSEFFKKLLLTQLQQILVGHTCVFLNRSRENI